ncbi:hypothetical protein AB0O91_17910 [Kitasatospora sp. NPDC089797]|uniref:hypothetical protein n=1 Tax=Kitasatospora sp. NPDC089797 TaxID=3155298 RepID=UPI00341637D3
MPRNTLGDAMPPALRSAAIVYAVETAGHLCEVLRYSSPAMAEHGWARMCMYRTADAMDTIGFLVDGIAVRLQGFGWEPAAIRGLLKVDQEFVRTARPERVGGRRLTERELHVMPEWIVAQVRDCVAFVLLRIPVMLRAAAPERNDLWVRQCLAPMVDSMDRLGRLARVFATVHVDVLDEHMLRRYQHLFQQRPRAEMPYPERPGDVFRTSWGDVSAGPEAYEVRALALLVLLDERFERRWWQGAGGGLRPEVRNAAVATLHALETEMSPPGDGHRYWLTEAEWIYAEAVSAALRDRLAALPDREQPLPEVLRALFERTPVRSER